MFRKILIANRGEIACRVIRTARRMGVATVAVYSDADADALHVAMADEAYRIGPPPARESYLRIEAVLDAARRAGAEAIHPGYGFLSENAAFAEACAAAGVVFIGPPASAIHAMGSKSAAKALMEQSGVPLVPGYHGADQEDPTFVAAAARIGYPVLIKASAGGGGKGMRVVERPEDLAEALAGARREGLSSFGDDRLLVEKYLRRPRHIEIQVFADTQGNTVSLFERDCSIQRRHQKIVEEAPAPGLPEAQRRAMGEAAVAAARAVGYVGAGTVEFIHEDKRFYFMEMNTRLQVEHPVTEMITGQDLVEWQLRVAAGERLPLTQEALRIGGHAIEVRVYAEDPTRDFMPSVGRLAHLRQPQPTAHVRVDSGVRGGDRIGVEYDPMIAKLIVHDTDRAAAVRRLRTALGEYEIAGVQSNLGLLRAIAAHPAFAAAELDTGFIGRHPEVLETEAAATPPEAVAAACLAVLLRRASEAAATADRSGDTWSPWAATDGWQPNLEGGQTILLHQGGTTLTARAVAEGAGWRLDLPDGPHMLAGEAREGGLDLVLDGVRQRVTVQGGDDLTVFLHGRGHGFRLVDPLTPAAAEAAAGGRVVAPIPGYVTKVLVEEGAHVARGQALVVIEAMKMELSLTAPADGTVAALRARAGEMVEEGAELVLITPD